MQNLKPQIHIMFRKAIMMGPSKADLLRALEETCHCAQILTFCANIVGFFKLPETGSGSYFTRNFLAKTLLHKRHTRTRVCAQKMRLLA